MGGIRVRDAHACRVAIETSHPGTRISDTYVAAAAMWISSTTGERHLHVSFGLRRHVRKQGKSLVGEAEDILSRVLACLSGTVALHLTDHR